MPSVTPSSAKPTLLRRLPQDYHPAQSEASLRVAGPSPIHAKMPGAPDLASETWGSALYSRHEGGLLSRALGTAVHALLEELARLRTTNDWNAARTALQRFEPRITSQVRASGVDPTQAAAIAAQALNLAISASRDPIAQWILSPHSDAISEARWAGVVSGALATVRVDRVFRAGLNPQSEGQQAWWIIDYKTAHAETHDPAASLPELRKLFAPQLEAYAQILRNLHGADAILRAGLYYPRMLLLDWWEL